MTLVVVTIAAFLASLLTLFSGFGLGTLLMPVVAVFFPVPVAVALTALVHLLNNLFKLAVLWRDIDWAVTWRFGVPALLATVPGAWLLGRMATLPAIGGYTVGGIDASITPVKLAVGLLLILFAIAEWFSLAKRVEFSQRLLPVGGVLSGFFGGLSGHQGAFRSAFLLHAGLDAQRFIASNAAIASLVDITRLLVYGLSLTLVFRQVDATVIAAAAVAAFAGVLAARLGIEKVTIGAIQRLVAVMLVSLGGLLVAGII